MRNVVQQLKAHRGALTPYQRASDNQKAPNNRAFLEHARKRRTETGIADCQRIWGQEIEGIRTEATLRQAFNHLAKNVVLCKLGNRLVADLDADLPALDNEELECIVTFPENGVARLER